MLFQLQQNWDINIWKWYLYCIIKGNRDETNTVDMAKAAKEAQDLYQVKQTSEQKKKWSDKNSMISLLISEDA